MSDEDNAKLVEVSSLDDTVINVLLDNLGDLWNGAISLITTIHPDQLGYTLVLMDQEEGEVIAKSAHKTFGGAVQALHARVQQNEEAYAQVVGSMDDPEEDDDEGD